MNAVDTLFLLSVGWCSHWFYEAASAGRVRAMLNRWLNGDRSQDAAALARKHLRER